MLKIPSFIKTSAAAVCGILLPGCALFSAPDQTAIEYYDLKQPEKLNSVPLNVAQFVNFTGERQRMIRRENGIIVRSSDFHKWMQSPGAMLTRYLRISFRNDMQADILKLSNPVTLSGEVLLFEVNAGYAKLGVRYHLKQGRQSFSKTVLISEKMEAKGPKVFAEAMSKAADKLVRQIALEAEKISAERK